MPSSSAASLHKMPVSQVEKRRTFFLWFYRRLLFRLALANDLPAEMSGRTLRSLGVRCKKNRRKPGRDRRWLFTPIRCIVLHGRKFRSG